MYILGAACIERRALNYFSKNVIFIKFTLLLIFIFVMRYLFQLGRLGAGHIPVLFSIVFTSMLGMK